MFTDTKLPQIISRQLESGQPIVLATIVELRGSSPRHLGSKMVIGTDGRNYGTIGGSIFEAGVINEARHLLGTKKSRFIDFDFGNNTATSSGMICGGIAVVLLDYIPVSPGDIALFHRWHDSIQRGVDFCFLTHVITTGSEINIAGHSILFRDGNIVGDSGISTPHLEIIKSRIHDVSRTAIISVENSRIIIDPIMRLKTLYCFGAGHVAVPTAHIAALVGFRVVVLDDRNEFANQERFPDAEQIHIKKDYTRAFEDLEIDEDSFVVIMTRGHRYDRAVLEQAMKTRASYIGMISSRQKRNIVYRALLAKGFQKQELERIHSPIGLTIGSETPEEIAVSIVAQLIKVRAGLAI